MTGKILKIHLVVVQFEHTLKTYVCKIVWHMYHPEGLNLPGFALMFEYYSSWNLKFILLSCNQCILFSQCELHFNVFSPGTSVGVSSILLGLVLIGRAAFVFPLSFLSNLTKKSESDKIGFKQQVSSFLYFSICFLSLWMNSSTKWKM